MRSRASFKGHPIHPALIAFPIAFLTGAFVCDLVGALLDSAAWWSFGGWLAFAGIVTAVLAAVPGIVDYLYTVPPRSSAKKRATMHMLANFGAVALFVFAWIIRAGANTEPMWLVVLIEAGGLVLLAVGGWMGGTLVYRNLIGVDHRYAQSGKWSEEYYHGKEQDLLPVAKADDLQINQMKLLHVGDKRIVLARTEEGFTAFDDRCTHKGGSLAGGALIRGRVQCLWHGSQFDVNNGQVCAGPADQAIRTYHVEERDGEVLLSLRQQPVEAATARES